jgi:L-fuconolactonase
VTPEQLPAAVETVRDLPHLRFVLDHGGKPRIGDGELDPWRAMISGLAVHENAAVKLSGLLTEARPEWALDDLRPFAEHLVDSFSAERVMFGSDWPVSILRAGYEDVVAITETLVEHCTPYERQQIFGGTAQRWYRLGGGR